MASWMTTVWSKIQFGVFTAVLFVAAGTDARAAGDLTDKEIQTLRREIHTLLQKRPPPNGKALAEALDALYVPNYMKLTQPEFNSVLGALAIEELTRQLEDIDGRYLKFLRAGTQRELHEVMARIEAFGQAVDLRLPLPTHRYLRSGRPERFCRLTLRLLPSSLSPAHELRVMETLVVTHQLTRHDGGWTADGVEKLLQQVHASLRRAYWASWRPFLANEANRPSALRSRAFPVGSAMLIHDHDASELLDWQVGWTGNDTAVKARQEVQAAAESLVHALGSPAIIRHPRIVSLLQDVARLRDNAGVTAEELLGQILAPMDARDVLAIERKFAPGLTQDLNWMSQRALRRLTQADGVAPAPPLAPEHAILTAGLKWHAKKRLNEDELALYQALRGQGDDPIAALNKHLGYLGNFRHRQFAILEAGLYSARPQVETEAEGLAFADFLANQRDIKLGDPARPGAFSVAANEALIRRVWCPEDWGITEIDTEGGRAKYATILMRLRRVQFLLPHAEDALRAKIGYEDPEVFNELLKSAEFRAELATTIRAMATGFAISRAEMLAVLDRPEIQALVFKDEKSQAWFAALNQNAVANPLPVLEPEDAFWVWMPFFWERAQSAEQRARLVKFTTGRLRWQHYRPNKQHWVRYLESTPTLLHPQTADPVRVLADLQILSSMSYFNEPLEELALRHLPSLVWLRFHHPLVEARTIVRKILDKALIDEAYAPAGIDLGRYETERLEELDRLTELDEVIRFNPRSARERQKWETAVLARAEKFRESGHYWFLKFIARPEPAQASDSPAVKKFIGSLLAKIGDFESFLGIDGDPKNPSSLKIDLSGSGTYRSLNATKVLTLLIDFANDEAFHAEELLAYVKKHEEILLYIAADPTLSPPNLGEALEKLGLTLRPADLKQVQQKLQEEQNYRDACERD
ncbi:MAG: hypothetical protein AB7P04_02995 [Bacteriovoracia bacterium]